MEGAPEVRRRKPSSKRSRSKTPSSANRNKVAASNSRDSPIADAKESAVQIGHHPLEVLSAERSAFLYDSATVHVTFVQEKTIASTGHAQPATANSQEPHAQNGSVSQPPASPTGSALGLAMRRSPSLSALNNISLGSLFDSISGSARLRLGDGQGSPDRPAIDGDQRLAFHEFVSLTTTVVEKFVRLIAKYWVDENGDGPLGRFLKIDRPLGGIGPTRRILWFLLAGFLLSVFALVLTEDEYYTGPKLDKKFIEMSESSDFYPVHISFENLGCYVNGVGQIISNISGDARPGRLMGILGASGSGKTTLAHALLGRSRRSCSLSTGSIFLNGAPGSLDSFLDRVGFVPQDDVLHAEMTVLETLRFAANSRLPRYLSDKYVDEIVAETMQTLDLTHLQDSPVGGPAKRGLSGGERKRVSIGLELVTLPSVLVLDEPTSGLDGAQAHKLIGTLKYIASRFNVSVVTVIHQPSSRSFSLFDDLILLQKGKLVYFGERSEAMSYFSSLPTLRDYFSQFASPKSEMNVISPAEILLDVSTGFTSIENGEFTDSDFFKKKVKEIRERERQYRLATKTLLVEDDEEEYELQRSIMKERCGGYKSELLRALCNIKSGLAFTLGFDANDDVPRLKYTKRAKRGILFQAHQWWYLLWTLTFRRGVKVEVFSILILAGTCAYLRHFNRSWQKKQVASFYISVSVGMVAMLGAAMEDDILPVRRAVSSGMLLGAHEFALVSHSLQKGFFLCHIFTFAYFGARYVVDPSPSAAAQGLSREFCCTPFSWRSYFRFHHLVQLNFFCARWSGLLVNVLVDYDERKSMVACCALLVGAHAFSLYSPQMSQLVKDGLIVKGVNFAKPMLFLCSFSYVRYFLEAMYLWDPDQNDRVGRDFVMRYFSYSDGSEAGCATTMTFFTIGLGVMRFLISAFRNANDYASFYDAPAFLIFLSKILAVYILLLIVAIIFHEFSGIKAAWNASVGVALKNRRTSVSLE